MYARPYPPERPQANDRQNDAFTLVLLDADHMNVSLSSRTRSVSLTPCSFKTNSSITPPLVANTLLNCWSKLSSFILSTTCRAYQKISTSSSSYMPTLEALPRRLISVVLSTTQPVLSCFSSPSHATSLCLMSLTLVLVLERSATRFWVSAPLSAFLKQPTDSIIIQTSSESTFPITSATISSLAAPSMTKITASSTSTLMIQSH